VDPRGRGGHEKKIRPIITMETLISGACNKISHSLERGDPTYRSARGEGTVRDGGRIAYEISIEATILRIEQTPLSAAYNPPGKNFLLAERRISRRVKGGGDYSIGGRGEILKTRISSRRTFGEGEGGSTRTGVQE